MSLYVRPVVKSGSNALFFYLKLLIQWPEIAWQLICLTHRLRLRYDLSNQCFNCVVSQQHCTVCVELRCRECRQASGSSYPNSSCPIASLHTQPQMSHIHTYQSWHFTIMYNHKFPLSNSICYMLYCKPCIQSADITDH